MNKKGIETLQQLVSKKVDHLVGYVVGAKDKNVQNDYFNEIKKLCVLNKIEHFEKGEITNINVDYKIAIGWRWIIPDYENLIILHDSLLPKYRGFAPLVNCLINGEKEIGVTALFANKEYDKGDIILQKRVSVNYPIKIAQAIKNISTLCGEIVLELFNKLNSSQPLIGEKQKEENATYSVWLDNEDYYIDWIWDAEKIKRKVDATGFPYLESKTRFDDKAITIINCEIMEDVKIENRTPGKIFGFRNKKPIIICGDGLLLLTELKDENGNPFTPKSLRKRFK